MFYLGGPVWGVKKWIGSLFPEGTPQREFLAAYSRGLNTVEGNTSFYAMPTLETVQRWRDETPPGFQFCFKFPRTISHDRMLRGAAAETRAWVDRLYALEDRAGPSFLQLPPNFTPQMLPFLSDYLSALPTDLRYAVEVRHPQWFTPGPEAALSALLRKHGIARVLFDVRPLRSAEPEDQDTAEAQERKPNVPVRRLRTASFTLIRYISHPDPAENAAYLEEWADTMAPWLTEGGDVYFFLHYPGDQHIPALCRDLYGRLAQRVPLPPLPPWGTPTRLPAQISLFD